MVALNPMPILTMKTSQVRAVESARPFTHGLARALVRQHAYHLFREKLPRQPLTLEDWMLAERALTQVQMTGATRIDFTTLGAVSAWAKNP